MSDVSLHLGDCLEVMGSIPDGSVTLVVADPPYNVSKSNAGGRHGFRRKKFLSEEWDYIEDYAQFSRDWMGECRRVMKDNATMYVWGYHRSFPFMPLDEWYPLNLIVWRKRNAFPMTMQNAIWSPSCEYAYFLRKSSGKDHTFHIGRKDFARDFFDELVVTNRRHPSEKPEKIITEFVRRSTNEGDTVLDPFMGSGTTGVPCVKLGMNFIGIEKNEKYFTIASKRIAEAQLQYRMESV